MILAPHLSRCARRTSACRTRPGHRPPAPPACAGPTRTSSTTTAGPSRSPARDRQRRDGHHHRRQLLRLLQEGSEDADQLRRQPVRPGRGGARGRRAGLPQLQPRRRVHPGPGAGRDRRSPVRRGRSSCSAIARGVHPTGYATDALSRRSTTCPRTWRSTSHRQDITLDQRRRASSASSSCPARLRPPERLQGADGEAPGRAELAPRAARSPRARFCHKPCTVSGGGKSEISKSLVDAILYGPIFVARLRRGHGRWSRRSSPRLRRPLPDHRRAQDPARAAVLSPERSLGSVIKLLTPIAGRLHRRVQRLAGAHPQPHPRAGLHHQALLPAGVGRRLARALHASTSSTARPGTS